MLATKGAETREGAMLEGFPDLLRVSDVCELTGLSPATVRREFESGAFMGKAGKIGRTWYLPKTAFLDFFGGDATC